MFRVFLKITEKTSLVGAAVSVTSAAVRLFSRFLCPGVCCERHNSYWAFHENVSFSRSWTLGSIFGVFASNAKNMLNGTSSRLRPLGPWRALHGCRRRNEWLSHGSSLHFTSLHFTGLHFTSLHFISLHFTSLHFASLHFTSLHFTSAPRRRHTWAM